MKGVQAYSFADFHPGCNVNIVEAGGALYVVCLEHRVIANLQAVSGKFEDYSKASKVNGESYPAKIGV